MMMVNLRMLCKGVKVDNLRDFCAAASTAASACILKVEHHVNFKCDDVMMLWCFDGDSTCTVLDNFGINVRIESLA